MSEPEPTPAQLWVMQFCEANQLVWDELSPFEKLQVTRQVPCKVRCWRVGAPVDTTPGEPCPECGQMVPTPTVWEHVTNPQV
jgi:hypothetical protein